MVRLRLALTLSELAKRFPILGCCAGRLEASVAACSLARKSRAGVWAGEETHEMSQGLI